MINYDFKKKLGNGAFGAVYLVRERTSGKLFAAKGVFTLNPGIASKNLSKEYKADFELTESQQGQLARLPHHDNIVSAREHFNAKPADLGLKDFMDQHPVAAAGLNLRDVGIDTKKCLFIIMDYMQSDLEKLARKRRTSKAPGFTSVEALVMLVQMLKAVHWQYIHKIVHRDLKPDNVLITLDSDCHEWSVKVCDFGLYWDARNFARPKGSFSMVNNGDHPGGAFVALAPEVWAAKSKDEDFIYERNDV